MTAPPPTRTARSPSPTALPLLRGPSPLGGKVLHFQDDGRITVSQPQRPASAPIPQPTGPRPPSPGSASIPLNPPIQRARQNSREELQKIDCHELRKLVEACYTQFGDLVKALVHIQFRISRHWAVPQRAARQSMKHLLTLLTGLSLSLSSTLSSLSLVARKLLTYIASRIQRSHGLRNFAGTVEDVGEVTRGLEGVRKGWEEAEGRERRFGEEVGRATLVLEEGMDPDGWTPSSPLSPPIHSLASHHRVLLSLLSRLTSLFSALSPSPFSWHPPLLSPEDVKSAAASWRGVERAAKDGAGAVRRETAEAWRRAGEMGFVTRGEREEGLRMLEAGDGAGAVAAVTAAMGGVAIAATVMRAPR
ncbi:hypothetical protein JCM8097_009239 [Rhodosporidiobolus ruineniae]